MGMNDCIKCWNTPCTCGWDYKDYSKEYFIKFINNILSEKDNEFKIEVLKEVLKLNNNGN